MQTFKNKKVTVFGLAKSGIASARRLVSLGAKVRTTEIKQEHFFDASLIKELKDLKIDLEFGGHTLQSIESADLIVVSPGIHIDIPILETGGFRKRRVRLPA